MPRASPYRYEHRLRRRLPEGSSREEITRGRQCASDGGLLMMAWSQEETAPGPRASDRALRRSAAELAAYRWRSFQGPRYQGAYSTSQGAVARVGVRENYARVGDPLARAQRRRVLDPVGVRVGERHRAPARVLRGATAAEGPPCRRCARGAKCRWSEFPGRGSPRGAGRPALPRRCCRSGRHTRPPQRLRRAEKYSCST